jgi:uncharacterized RDD family membrane protein YckC
MAPTELAPTAAPPPSSVIGRRVAARVVDYVLVIGPFGAVFGSPILASVGRSGAGLATLLAVDLFAECMYYALCEGTVGATLGKALFGLRVRSLSSGRCTIPQAALRWLGLVVDLVPYCLPVVGVVVMVRSPLQQRAGDRLAGTVVLPAASLPPAARPPPVNAIAGVMMLLAVYGFVAMELLGYLNAGAGQNPWWPR